MKNTPSLLSRQEIEALVRVWPESANSPAVDAFFPLRMVLLGIASLWGVVALLFFTDNIASSLSNSPAQIAFFKSYIYFRGWCLLVLMLCFSCSYVNGKHVGIVFGVVFLLASTNFVSDMFTVYAERLKNPTPMFTLLLIGRLTAILFVFLAVKNAHRLPEKGSRFDIFLPFRRSI